MTTHVKFIDCTGMEPLFLGHSIADLENGLPEIAVSSDVRDVSRLTGEPIRCDVLKEALGYLDPDSPRQEWRDIIAGIHAAPLSDDPDESKRRELAHAFSRGKLDRLHRYDCALPERYTGPDEVDKVFDTMPPKPGGIGVGTIISAARKQGFTGNVSGTSAKDAFAHYRPQAGERAADTPARNKFRLILPHEMRSLPEPAYVVTPIVADCAVTLIYGAPASFKSFVVMDLLASTSSGVNAFEKFSTVQGDTVLCAGEAPFGIARKRWPAWARARNIADPERVPFAIVPAVPLVSDPAEIDALLSSITATGMKPRIVAIDTVALAIGGLDENDARAAGLMLRAANGIRDKFNCAVLLVHHAGKDGTKGARGSSALVAGVDAVFRVVRETDTLAVKLHCEKMKDADEPEDIHLKGRIASGSLVFDWIAKDEHASLTRKNGGPSRSDVGAALRKLGQNVLTRPLAVELVGPEAGEDEINAMVRLLQRKGQDAFRAYIVHRGTGGRDATKWGLPNAHGDVGQQSTRA